MSDSDMERLEGVAADAWKQWPEETAAAAAARRSHVRARLSGELSYTLVQRYDAANEADGMSERIDWLLALAQPLAQPRAGNTYSIERDNDRGFRVRVTNPDRNWHVVTGFASETEAGEWAQQQIEIERHAVGK